MAIFTKTGDDPEHFWLVDGSPDFSIMPANTMAMFPEALPIRLHVGNQIFGQVHTEKHWNKKTAGNRTVPELIHYKLGQSGRIHCTEKDSKIKIVMSLSPGGLMVMEHRHQTVGYKREYYFSVITFYKRTGVDGDEIGRYEGRRRLPLVPIVPPKVATEDLPSNEPAENPGTAKK